MEFISVALGIVALGLLLVIAAKRFESNKQNELLPFKLKKNFFSQSEYVLYNTLLEELDVRRFRIFSKVRLADFIETTATGKEFYTWFNQIKSKHIDFIIWDTKKDKIALGIELDGSSHKSRKTTNRDDFVNKLYKELNFPIKRIEVGKVFKDEAEEIKAIIEVE